MTTKPRILVTSAAGRNGSAAVLELLGKGFPTFGPRPLGKCRLKTALQEGRSDPVDDGYEERPPHE